MPYLLLERFRNLFEGVRYRHRDSSLGDSVARRLPEDLYALHRSAKFNDRVDAKERVLNLGNKLHGINARRGDGTFGEIVPDSPAIVEAGSPIAIGKLATIEIGVEVKIIANSMIKQIDRVINDLDNQQRQFETAGGTPITIGIVGINHTDRYVSYEGDKEYPTGSRNKKHPIREAAEAENRVKARVAPRYFGFLLLRFRASNEPPYPFEWVDQSHTELDYGAMLTRIVRKYDATF